jgi:hypothetical protein
MVAGDQNSAAASQGEGPGRPQLSAGVKKDPPILIFALGEREKGHYKNGLVARDQPVPRRESLWRAGSR